MKRLIFTFLACLGAASTYAANLVEKLPMPGTDYGGLVSNVGVNYEREADDFSVNEPAQVNALTWYGWVADPNLVTADFDILFFEDIGLPSNPAFYTTTLHSVTGSATNITTSSGITILKWTATIPMVDFPDAGTYWISIQAHTNSIESSRWIWAFGEPIDGETAIALQDNGSTDWQASSQITDAFAFSLSNVPVSKPVKAMPWLNLLLDD